MPIGVNLSSNAYPTSILAHSLILTCIGFLQECEYSFTKSENNRFLYEMDGEL